MPSREVQAMCDAVHMELYGPQGVYWRLPEEQRRKIGFMDSGGRWHDATEILVEQEPSDYDLGLVGGLATSDGRRDHLLGLFTDGPEMRLPRIQLFHDEIVTTGRDAGDVLKHELGHRIYDTPDYPDEGRFEVVAMFGAGAVDAPDSEVTLSTAGTGLCGGPICQMDSMLSEVERALYGLRERSHMQHRIPDGLGGRIPEQRRKLALARDALSQVATMVPDRAGEVRSLRGLIDRTDALLQGDALGPDDISRAHQVAARAWDAGFDLGHAFYLQRAAR